LTVALKRFQSSHPEVSLEIVVAGPTKIDQLLANQEIDFAICDPSSATAALVMEWSASPAWFASAELTIDPLRSLPLVLWHSSSSWQNSVLDSLRDSGWEWRVVFESASLDATLAAVESGLGVAAFLRETVRNAGIAEVKNVRLPALPQVRLGLFRSPAAASRAQSLMEAALATALMATVGGGAALPKYPLPVEDVHSRVHDHS
jgi:DNA-binding transcriptional LysR family regulator